MIPSLTDILAASLHGVAFLANGYVMFLTLDEDDLNYALSFWVLILQILYFGLCFGIDVWNFIKGTPLAVFPCVLSKTPFTANPPPNRSLRPRAEAVRDILFGVTFSATNFVGLMFWTLIARSADYL
eukprot:TRINITY_DN4546_c0_g1_i3.p1 TRINITY_DN4546_c0_g1~~TRINITY_DN4546_c0_g1_i3.p1  ORF type:complete len:127 (+),score=17.18 TRINITY_DN4546_c0_g1_i3:54-434(+)